jgi:hypothetical protein
VYAGPTAGLPEITDVKQLTLRPGDRLVVRLARTPSMQQAHDIRMHMREYFAPGVPVLVLGPDEDVEIIGPPQPDGT